MPGDGPALLGVPEIELLSIIIVMCETINNKTNDRKFDMGTRHAEDSQNFITNKDPQTKLDADNASGDKTNILNYHNSSTNKTQMLDYFHSIDNKEADKRESEAITNRIHSECNDLFSGIGCFEGTFPLQVKEGSHPYQTTPRRVGYALQKPLKEELEWLQKKQIIVALGAHEMSKCQYNSFILVPKTNGKVRLCLDLVQLNKALIRPIYRAKH